MSKTSKKSAADPDFASLDFETAMKELQAVVERMESADLPLQEMLDSYERGMALSTVCQKALDDATLRVEQISKGKNGKLKATPMDAPE